MNLVILVHVPPKVVRFRACLMMPGSICLLGLFKFDFQFEVSCVELLYGQMLWNLKEKAHRKRVDSFYEFSEKGSLLP